MTGSASGKSSKHPPNIWKDAYNALAAEDKGKERLHRLNDILREEIGQPKLKMRSEDGYKQLQTFINKRSQNLRSSKALEKAGNISSNMLKIEELVSGAANVGGPYVAIPAAALFMAFSVQQIYQTEKESMFKLAKDVARYTVFHATASERVMILPDDNDDMRDMKRRLRDDYVEFYKALIFATAQITISIYGDWQFVKNVLKYYDWEGQIKDLSEQHRCCIDGADEIIRREKDPKVNVPSQKALMGPAPRNPLHVAAAFGVQDRVAQLVQTKEYPINALTPRKWTAAHLAARECNVEILKILLTADGVDLRIKNVDGDIPLHIAVLHNRAENVKVLLRRDWKSRGICDSMGRTACTIAASKGYVDVLVVLWEAGQDFNETKSTNGWTALHLAAEGGDVEAVQYLLKHGAKKDARLSSGRRTGYTAKQIAELEKKLDVVEIL